MFVIIALVVYCLALMPALTRFPAPINDEGREANLFWVASGAEPGAERVNAHRGFPTWGTGGLQGATAAVIFRVAGMGVFQARLTSLVWGGVLLAVVYLLGTRYWNRAVGAAAITLIAVSNPFLLSTHTLRPDVQVATLMAGALLLSEIALRRGSAWIALVSGVLLGLSVDTHLNSIGFLPLVAAPYLLRRGSSLLSATEWWGFVAGLALAGLYYVGVRVGPDAAGFATAMGYWLGVDKAPPAARGGLGLVGMVGDELARYWDYFGEEPLELVLVLVGLAAGAWWAIRGSYPARVIMLGLIAAFLFFVVAVSMKSKYYMLLTYPFYMLLAARVLERASGAVAVHLLAWLGASTRPPDRATRWARHVAPLRWAVLTLLVVVVAWWPMKLDERAWDNYIQARRYREGQEYAALTARLDGLAGPGARVLAPPVYWIGLKDHPFVDIFVFERLHRQYGMSPAQFLDEVRPDFVITDAKIATEKTLERLLYRELDLRANYELIVRHKNYGDIAVYRLRQ